MNIYTIENDPLPFVKPCNSLLIKIKHDKIGILTLKLRTIQNLELVKESLELLKFACLIVENLLNGKKYKDKLNVKDLIFLAYEKVFGNNNFNRDNISNQIQFLYDNEQITPSTISSKIYKTIEHWLSRKEKIISIIYDNLQDAMINICINKASESTSLIIPNFGLTKLLNLPIIELMFKMKFMITVIII